MTLGHFTDSTPLTPLRDAFNVLVDAVNANETAISDATDARQIQTFRWADSTERAAQTGMQAGDIGYQIDTTVLYRYNGSAWRGWSSEWITFTPTYTGFTVGAGGFTKYRYINGQVLFAFRLPVSSMTSNPTMTVPVNFADTHTKHFPGIALIPGAGSEVVGVARRSAANNVVFYYNFVSGSTVFINNVATTAPFTWSSTGVIEGTLFYDPA